MSIKIGFVTGRLTVTNPIYSCKVSKTRLVQVLQVMSSLLYL